MEESREVRKIYIVYSLCDNGNIEEEPHLMRVNHLSGRGVRLRDVKRWLSEQRGEGMPECFAWSYKRSYRGGYVWQDLIDDDLITAISDNKYVVKGSLLPSLTKTTNTFLDGENSPIKQEAMNKDSHQLKMHENILSSERMNGEDRFFRIGSIWLEERNITGEEKSSDTIAKKKMKKTKKTKKKTTECECNGRKSINVMRNLIGCMTVETKGSACRVMQREDSSVAGKNQESNSKV